MGWPRGSKKKDKFLGEFGYYERSSLASVLMLSARGVKRVLRAIRFILPSNAL